MKKARPLLFVVGTTIVLSAGLLAVASVLNRATIQPDKSTLSYWVAHDLEQYQVAIVSFAKSHGLNAQAVSQNEADIVVGSKPTAGSIIVGATQIGIPVKLKANTVVSPVARPNAYLTTPRSERKIGATTLKVLTPELTAALNKTKTDHTWRLNALGDIIIGRTVYLQMLRYDPLHPFEKYAEELRSTDLTIADLENSFSDSRAIITSEGMTFVSPSRGADGLKSSGIDAVNIANNHSYNAGSAGYLDTIATLDNLGIPHFGGGKNETEAHTPYVTTVKDTRVAMLGYSSIVGSSAATSTNPGMAYLDMAPWGKLNEDQVKHMEQDIRDAKAGADVVLVYYHWGQEYTHEANADQRSVAHRAIDAGADVILGTHPHWVQGIEWYRDRLIAYSLGNFIFDQEWAFETKQGTILQLTFDGATIAGASLAPYTISDYNQPAPATPTTAQKTLNAIFTHSWWPL